MSDTDDAIRAMINGGARATGVIAEDLLGDGQREAPLEFGTLRGSGHIVYIVNGAEHPDLAAATTHALELGARLRTFIAEVRFSTVYAARQHEETTWKHPRGGKAKYLEDPLKAKAPRYEGVLAAAIRPQLH